MHIVHNLVQWWWVLKDIFLLAKVLGNSFKSIGIFKDLMIP